MNLFIEGDIDKKDLIEIYVINVMKHLKIDRRKSVEVLIRFKKRMPKGCGECAGLCEGNEIEAIIDISKKYTFYEQMITLAHELVHAKQFFKGEYPSETEAKTREYGIFGRCFPWELT